MRGLPNILSLFRNKFNKFNNTGQSFFHHYGTMTHTPGIGNFSTKMPKIGNHFSAFSCIVKS